MSNQFEKQMLERFDAAYKEIDRLHNRIGLVLKTMDETHERMDALSVKQKMPNIKEMEIFSTPEKISVVEDFIAQHPQEQRVSLYTAMGMTWNYIASQISKHNDEGDKNAE